MLRVTARWSTPGVPDQIVRESVDNPSTGSTDLSVGTVGALSLGGGAGARTPPTLDNRQSLITSLIIICLYWIVRYAAHQA